MPFLMRFTSNSSPVDSIRYLINFSAAGSPHKCISSAGIPDEMNKICLLRAMHTTEGRK